ncbi:MAG: UvrD-helicase domain-containing protein, partial [Treponema sp.]|nr:UvrD-helicase domain-containing protein [Treponema sp.]
MVREFVTQHLSSILLVGAGISILIIIFVSHRKKTIKYQVIVSDRIIPEIDNFFCKFNELKKDYISTGMYNLFVSKWKLLFSKIQKYNFSNKLPAYEKIDSFIKTYSNLQQIITDHNKDYIHNQEIKIKKFYDELDSISHSYITYNKCKEISNKWSDLFIINKKQEYSPYIPEHNKVINFLNEYSKIEELIETKNQLYIQNEIVCADDLLSNIDGKSLDEQQRAVVVSDEDRTLVLAGAGSGKTLTIAAKVKYLCVRKDIDPKNILLISFTNKSATEMTERIKNKLGIPVEATTFHK